jgi:hypothetical protein
MPLWPPGLPPPSLASTVESMVETSNGRLPRNDPHHWDWDNHHQIHRWGGGEVIIVSRTTTVLESNAKPHPCPMPNPPPHRTETDAIYAGTTMGTQSCAKAGWSHRRDIAPPLQPEPKTLMKHRNPTRSAPNPSPPCQICAREGWIRTNLPPGGRTATGDGMKGGVERRVEMTMDDARSALPPLSLQSPGLSWAGPGRDKRGWRRVVGTSAQVTHANNSRACAGFWVYFILLIMR